MKDGTHEVRSATEAGSVRVVVADDQTMFRRGLARILGSCGGVEVAAEIPNDEWALRLSLETSPDVVLMEVHRPFERTREMLRWVRSFTPQPKVIIVTMLENPHYLRELMRLGVSACLLKSASVEELIAAIRTAVFDS